MEVKHKSLSSTLTSHSDTSQAYPRAQYHKMCDTVRHTLDINTEFNQRVVIEFPHQSWASAFAHSINAPKNTTSAPNVKPAPNNMLS